jgi:adenylate cyclase
MIGMGVHAGEAISGNIGSEERMEFTVIGDTVNMASRIEASTKAFGVDLLLSEDVATEVQGRFLLKVAGSSKVYGKAQPLKLYKVMGYVENGQERLVRTPYSDYEQEHVDKVEVV